MSDVIPFRIKLKISILLANKILIAFFNNIESKISKINPEY